jgi:hypothetical protein
MAEEAAGLVVARKQKKETGRGWGPYVPSEVTAPET